MRSKTRPQLMLLALVGGWALLHLYLAAGRSIWMDELTRYDQMRFGLLDSLKMLFAEPSPFAPGEIFLGQLSRIAFGGWTSLEFWGRISSVIWGALTVWFAAMSGVRFLSLLVFFSVALTSFSTQFRPYSALFFSGALVFRMLWDKRKLSRGEELAAWFAIFLGHLYGICFIAAASVARKEWKRAVGAGLYVAVILLVYLGFHHGTVSNWQRANFPGVLGTIKQCLGVMGNPHKASYLLVPLFVYGMYVSTRKNISLATKLAAFFAATVLAPIAATYFGRYFFMPRQVAAGAYGFLFLACTGLAALAKRFSAKSKRFTNPAAVAVVVTVSVLPWIASTLLAIPPFADQPFHRYKQIAHQLEDHHSHRVLLIDPGGTLTWYLEEDRGKPDPGGHFTRHGFALRRICWANLCLIALLDSKYLYGGPEQLERSPEFVSLLVDPSLRITEIVHGYEKFEVKTTVPVIRTW